MTLLDTHLLLWIELEDRRLGTRTRTLIAEAWEAGEAAVSAVSFWEVALLRRRGRLEGDLEVEPWRKSLLDGGMIELPLDGRTAIQAVQLQDFHADPADRFIVATALTGGHRLITADREILDWPGPLARHPATE